MHGAAGTRPDRGTDRQTGPPSLNPGQALDTWTCSASLDAWDDPYQCPDLSSGFYTFKNDSPGDDGIYVYICNATPNEDSCDAPGTAFYLNDPGDTQSAGVPPGYNVYIEGADLVEHEQLVLSATPYTS
jgi:hypothetical protein